MNIALGIIDPMRETTLMISECVNFSRSSNTRAKEGQSFFNFWASDWSKVLNWSLFCMDGESRSCSRISLNSCI